MGRRATGRRETHAFRPTNAVAARLREVTHNGAKVSISAYVAKVMADHFELPDFEPDLQLAKPQQELPMREAG